MNKLLLIFSLITLQGFSKPKGEGTPVSLEEVRKIRNKTYEEDEKRYLKNCRWYVNWTIREAAEKGDNYVHISMNNADVCFGTMFDDISKDLSNKGFKVKLDSAGIYLVHYDLILTVGW